MSINKYFWSLNPKALKELKLVLNDQEHPRFMERLFTLFSRCDNPKEVFSVIDRRQFIEVWPRLRRHWTKAKGAFDFKSWWETVYEELLNKQRAEKSPKGRPLAVLLKIGSAIREKRVGKGISQSDFALQVGMRQPDISAIEAGKKNVTLETLMRLCKILDIKNISF